MENGEEYDYFPYWTRKYGRMESWGRMLRLILRSLPCFKAVVDAGTETPPVMIDAMDIDIK